MSRAAKWPPPRTKKRMDKGRRVMRDGEPNTIELHRYETDATLRGEIDNACCDCGLRHLLAFEVFRDPAGRWYLNKRTYRIGGSR